MLDMLALSKFEGAFYHCILVYFMLFFCFVLKVEIKMYKIATNNCPVQCFKGNAVFENAEYCIVHICYL